MRHFTLRVARMRAKLTVSELARRAGITRITVQRLERGRTLPQYETKQRLEAILGVPLTFARQSRRAA